MSTGSAPSSGGKNLGQDVELNIASIVDCFTVLITYLLAAASFLTVGAIDVTVAGTDSPSTDPAPPPAQVAPEPLPTDLLVMELTKDFHIEFKTYGTETTSTSLNASAEGKYDYDSAAKFIESYKAKHPALPHVILSAQNEVLYADLVQATDLAKKTIPVVLASGDSI